MLTPYEEPAGFHELAVGIHGRQGGSGPQSTIRARLSREGLRDTMRALSRSF